ncbi:hypothetical protein AB0E85_19680 [Streptomyces sp. NPDC029044]|uniref:hypothetical protein n=1 Tax=Streptomyces sp. NPDC029044 TaxID=3157198 RepID=UPI0033CD151D
MTRVQVRLLVTTRPYTPVRHAVIDVLDTDIRTVATTVATTGAPHAVTLPGAGSYLAQARLTTGIVVRAAFRTGDPGNCVLLDARSDEEHHGGPSSDDPSAVGLTWWGTADGQWTPVDGTAAVHEGIMDAFASPDDGILALQVDTPDRPARTTLLPPRAHAVIRASRAQDWRVELPETMALALLTFLDRGDVSNAREVASRLRTTRPAGTSLMDDLALAYLRLRTDLSLDAAHLRQLRDNYPWSSDAALLHGWHAGSVTGDRTTAQTALATALELGPPVLRLGLRMLYDGLHILGLDTRHRAGQLRELLRCAGPGPLTSFAGTAASALWPTRTSAPTPSPRSGLSPTPNEAPFLQPIEPNTWRTDLGQCLTRLNRAGFLNSCHRSAGEGVVRTLAWLDPDDGDTSSLTVAATPAPISGDLPGAAPTLALHVSAQDHRLATMDRHGRAVFHRVPHRPWLSLTVLPPAPGPDETPVPALASRALSAHGGNDILQNVTGPHQEVELTVSATDSRGRYIVDLTVRTTTGAPRIVPLSYHTLSGERRHLLVACRYRALTRSATASAVCTNVDPHVGWTLRSPVVASDLSSWSVDIISDSVAAAANKISRDAWAAAGAACGDEGIRRLIDDGLTG